MTGRPVLSEFTLEAETRVVYEEVEGVRIAVDQLYRILVNNIHHGDIVAMPINIDDIALGLLASGLKPRRPEEAEIRIGQDMITINTRDHTSLRPGTLLAEGCSGAIPARGARVNGSSYTWSHVSAIYPDFASRTAGNRYRISAHTVAIYSLDDGRVIVAHDTSRHTAVLKAIGLAYKAGMLTPRRRLAAASTGRASADMVYRLSSVGVGLMITMRGPLYSGLEAARRAGVTLVSNAKTGRSRSLLTLTGSLANSRE